MPQTHLLDPWHQLIEFTRQLLPGHTAHQGTLSHHLLHFCTASVFPVVIHWESFYGLHFCAWNSARFSMQPCVREDESPGFIHQMTLHYSVRKLWKGLIQICNRLSWLWHLTSPPQASYPVPSLKINARREQQPCIINIQCIIFFLLMFWSTETALDDSHEIFRNHWNRMFWILLNF